MKLKIRMIILLCVFGFVPVSSAEYYKYTDENGNIHYTDDFSKVPGNQRKDVEGYAEVGRSETLFGDTQKDKKEKPGPESKETTGKGDSKADKTASEDEYLRFQEKRNSLVEEQQSIEAEYKALMEEKSALEKERKPRMLRPQVTALNEKTDALNQKIAEFEKRRAGFDEKAKTFNDEIESSKENKNEENKSPKDSQ